MISEFGKGFLTGAVVGAIATFFLFAALMMVIVDLSDNDEEES